MSIRSVLLNVADVPRAVDFYTRFLAAVPVGEVSEHGADLDLVTATIRLRRVDRAAPSSWIADDLHAGFRHVGFKVAALDPIVAALHEAGVRFHLEPLEAEGGVRLTFFYDPDGTLLELVEGPLQYHEVLDREAVESDWALGTPERPRLDHVAETVADLDRTVAYYAPLGWRHMSGIHQPSDARGFEIAFLRSGDTSLEIFTFDRAELVPATPRVDVSGSDGPGFDAPGFVAVELDPAPPAGAGDVTLDRWRVGTDPDGLAHATALP
ncbi:hypothetical protein GCM10009840_11960 [Pseudolysinimonas kribbensis]|uniref:VOC family protein n=1 Tax=Pseudolysinimonas kribbensis TaxID=433641 RepID=UPI0031E37BD6